MAKLKRNMIELVKNPEEVLKGGEIEFEKFWTPPFLPLEVTYEAIDLMEKIEGGKGEIGEKEMLDLLMEFISSKVYGGQFSSDDLLKRLHAPDAVKELEEQVLFITQGQQTEETKKFLAKKN